MHALNFATVEQESSHDRSAASVLDVDDALLRTDLLHETAVATSRPIRFVLFSLGFPALLQGKAVLKRKLSERVLLEIDHLPVNEDLVAFAAAEHAKGRKNRPRHSR